MTLIDLELGCSVQRARLERIDRFFETVGYRWIRIQSGYLTGGPPIGC